VFKKKEEKPKEEEKTSETKPAAFSFVKQKVSGKQEVEDVTRHSMPAVVSKPEQSAKGGGFNFIKQKATATVNEQHNSGDSSKTPSSIAVSLNLGGQEQSGDINTYGNIDQFLTENATNLADGPSGGYKVPSVNGSQKDNISSHDAEDNRSEKKVETKAVPASTKSFNFIKKHKETVDDSKSQKTEEIINETSDIKSLKSLGIGHTDTLSITQEDDFRSAKYKTHSTTDIKDIPRGYEFTRSTKEITSIPKPMPSPQNNLNPQQIKSKCEADLQKNEDSFENLIVRIHNQKLKLRAKEVLKEELTTELEQCILKEEEAIQNNDFDAAQEIENHICELRDRIESVAAQVTDLGREMSSLRDNELLLIRNKTKVVDESMNAFNKLKSNQEYELETFQNNDINKHKNDNIKIKKLKEKLEILNNNLENEKSVSVNV
jgi:hypothetical protein